MTPFTPRLTNVLAHANALATYDSTRKLSAMHMLYGILHLGEGASYDVLTEKGITEIDIAPAPMDASHSIMDPSVMYAPCALQALASAILKAVQLSQTYVGVEHLTLGILTNPSPKVVELLKKKRLNPDDLIQCIMKKF